MKTIHDIFSATLRAIYIYNMKWQKESGAQTLINFFGSWASSYIFPLILLKKHSPFSSIYISINISSLVI